MEEMEMNNNKQQRIIATNKDTGEIVAELILEEGQTVGVVKDLTESQKAFVENLRAKKTFTSSLGGFIMVLHNNNQNLFGEKQNPHEKISKANIPRLMMLATYINYENVLVLDVEGSVVHKALCGIYYMNKRDMKHILNLKDTVFKQFYKEIVSANILIENENGTFSLNREYFYKGSLDDYKDGIERNYIRMYIDTTRQIYRDTSASQRSILTYVFQLAPHIHYATNFICKDVSCPINAIHYMSIKDICSQFGLTNDKTSVKRFKEKMLSLSISYQGENYMLVKEIDEYLHHSRRKRYMINPLLFASTSQMSNVEAMMEEMLID